eukprot:TRINITY_DN0_c122_g1_i1.p2 TRINITY_DN0_c122_g1~~TRINITY_DN0_c122_g1_i1.p2  ORF type:complete len:64 (+),score=14.81 TRINITY_DN0_c122_g1_i1:30-194(+)
MSDSDSDDDVPLIRPTTKKKQIDSGSDSDDDEIIAPVKKRRSLLSGSSMENTFR